MLTLDPPSEAQRHHRAHSCWREVVPRVCIGDDEIAALTGSHKGLPMNSGAEAVESAIKSVRKWGYWR